MKNLSALAVNVAAALDNQRSGALVINLLLVQLQNNAPTLTTANCWALVGGKGKPTKQAPHQRTYFKANSLQRNAKEIAETLKGEPTDAWHDFIALIEVIDFTSATLQTDAAFVAAIAFMEERGNYACNGADVRAFIASLFEAAEGSNSTTEEQTDGEQAATASASAPDTVSAEAGQAAGDIEAEKDLAVAMLADLAKVDSIVGKTITSLIGLDPVVALQQLAQAWQADRTRLLGQLDQAEAQLEKIKAEAPAKPAKAPKSDFGAKLAAATAAGAAKDEQRRTAEAKAKAKAEAEAKATAAA